MWMDKEMLDDTFAFMGEGDLDHAFFEVVSSLDYKKICSRYHRFVILLHGCLFSLTSSFQ